MQRHADRSGLWPDNELCGCEPSVGAAFPIAFLGIMRACAVRCRSSLI